MELGGVKASPHADLIYKGIDFAKKEKVDFILAVGGGSVMDSAKGLLWASPMMEISGILLRQEGPCYGSPSCWLRCDHRRFRVRRIHGFRGHP